jgi:hypothetical protein
MNRPRLIRVLRILWTVFCGIACVLLIVLWVRSNYCVDQVFVPVTKSTYVILGSMPNAFGVGLGGKSPTVTRAWLNMRTVEWLKPGGPSGVPFSGARFFRIYILGIMMPYWSGVLLSSAFAILPWVHLPKRFSLRTLLIATTLIACVLGLIVWAIR